MKKTKAPGHGFLKTEPTGDVLDYLKANNLNRADLSKIAFRFSKKAREVREKPSMIACSNYWKTVTIIIPRFGPIPFTTRTWTDSNPSSPSPPCQPMRIMDRQSSAQARSNGPWLVRAIGICSLVHARAHRLGKERRILNNRLHAQYLKLLEVLKYKPTLDQQDHLALCYYLFAQDRIEEGLAHFDQVEKEQVREKLQYDYFAVNAAFYRLELRKAEEIAKRYERFGIDRWRTLFAEARAHLSEAKAGLDPKIIDEEDRNQQMDQLADTEPTFSFEFLGDQIRIEHNNIEGARIRFYPMEVELLFSRQPFAKNDAEHFTLVSPDGEESLEIAEGEKKNHLPLA